MTTACLEDTAWNLGAPSPSGGAGPVLHLLQLLGALPAEFTAQTCKEKSGRPVESKKTSGRGEGGSPKRLHTAEREALGGHGLVT